MMDTGKSRLMSMSCIDASDNSLCRVSKSFAFVLSISLILNMEGEGLGKGTLKKKDGPSLDVTVKIVPKIRD